jgi:Skp family chaperone for outer membrane proteins
MQADSLEVLQKADVPPRQARAFVHAIEIEMIGALSTLATKQGLETAKQDLETKIGALSSEMKVLRADLETKFRVVASDLKVLRADLDTKIESVRANLETKIGEVGGEVKVLRADLQTTREELRKEMQSMRADLVAQMHASMNRSTWQLCGLTVTLMGMMLGVVYFLVAHNVQ